jgi:hypothetical protein
VRDKLFVYSRHLWGTKIVLNSKNIKKSVHSACKLGERNNEVKLVVEMIKGLGGKKLGLSSCLKGVTT